MKNLTEKTAIVTGAGSGIGAGIALALGQAGVKVAVADIRKDAADETRRQLEAQGCKAIAIEIDVSDPKSVAAAAAATEQAFGRLHLAINNAGVAMHGTSLEATSLEDWDWVMGVNIRGVVHGIRSFLPLIRKHGEGGHIVNTSSIGGLQVQPGWNTGAYSMTKYAVVALSEALEQELKGSGIGVSVFCPAAVSTDLHASAKSRPARFGGPFVREEQHFLKDLIAGGLTPLQAGEHVVRGIREDAFFIFSHSAPRAWIEARHQRLMAAFDRTAQIETGGI
ncbi:MAG: SDR family NAD(P)-dependent oxidoreductase [Pseudomonadota bacterium]